MSTTTEAPATPDLSSLTPRQRLNVRVAQTQGWSDWKLYTEDGDGYPWCMDGPFPLTCYLRADGRPVGLSNVPDYATDPSAWGALMERELDGWTCAEGTAHHCYWHDEEGSRLFGAWCKTLGESVCAAVLQKHGIDPTPYIGG